MPAEWRQCCRAKLVAASTPLSATRRSLSGAAPLQTCAFKSALGPSASLAPAFRVATRGTTADRCQLACAGMPLPTDHTTSGTGTAAAAEAAAHDGNSASESAPEPEPESERLPYQVRRCTLTTARAHVHLGLERVRTRCSFVRSSRRRGAGCARRGRAGARRGAGEMGSVQAYTRGDRGLAAAASGFRVSLAG